MLEKTSKERPILFSASMVRAILAGRKTQTRRLAKGPVVESLNHPQVDPRQILHACPYGAPGDRLWVRETWCPVYHGSYEPWPRKEKTPESFHFAFIQYNADYQFGGSDYDGFWRPSIHMPRWASRITLEITGVRVQRLNDISDSDALAEGVSKNDHGNYWVGEFSNCAGFGSVSSFHSLWSTIHASDGPNGWAANPWVWVVEFKRVTP